MSYVEKQKLLLILDLDSTLIHATHDPRAALFENNGRPVLAVRHGYDGG